MTLGDRSLETEVLRLFERQSAMLLGRMTLAEPAKLRALAHTLNGSARGIGAWRVAHAAQALEVAATDPVLAEPAMAALRAAIDEAGGRHRSVAAGLLNSTAYIPASPLARTWPSRYRTPRERGQARVGF